MRQCLLHLIRHGQTDWNAQKRLQGHADIALNKVGLAEAELVAQEFAGRRLGGIYSSPLQRAHLTAQIINRSHQHEIKLYEDLKEATYGSMEGMLVDEYYTKCTEILPDFHEMTYQQRLHFKIVEDAESYFEVYKRAKPILDEIIQNHLGEEVAIVTHGGLMRAVIAMIAGSNVRKIHIQNVGYLTLVGDGSKLTIQGHQRITYDARLGFENLDSARQSKIEAPAAERERPFPVGKADEEERFGKVAASPNSQNLSEHRIL
jgi:probable phosphoglycerate mutase